MAKCFACEDKNSIFNSTEIHRWIESVLGICCVPFTAAFHRHAKLKRSLLSNGNLFAAVRPFASTSPKEFL